MNKCKIYWIVVFYCCLGGFSLPGFAEHKLNLNTANAAQLRGSFKGIGKQRAKAIVAYRKSHGEFHSLNDLGHVRGLGRRFVKRNRVKLSKIFTVDE